MLEALTILTTHPCRPEMRETVRDALATEFPTLLVAFVCRSGKPDVAAAAFFDDSFDLWAFDGWCEEMDRGPWALRIGAAALAPRQLAAVVTRCQRLIRRRDAASATQAFDRVLAAHRELHDLGKPLVTADYRHSLDVWQWLFRLDPAPSLALQCAALFHDIERLSSEADFRIEHRAADYQQFKDAHAGAGAVIARRVLTSCGIPHADADRAARLIARHERPEDDEEVATLNDADALSFFSMNSSSYADYFGAEQTEKKVAYTLQRMRPAAQARLDSLRLRSDVARRVARLRPDGSAGSLLAASSIL